MNGTTADETVAIDCNPPRTTSATISARMMLVQTGSSPNEPCIASLIEFACVVVPIPSIPAAAPKKAKSFASQSHFSPIPISIYRIGPPDISPFLSTVRYLMERSPSAYFVAIPRKAAAHIQKSAPGPPAAIAVATPTMFPVPMVAASAVQSDLNEVTSPSPSFVAVKMRASAIGSFVIWSTFKRTVSKSPVPMSRTSIGSPQMALFNESSQLIICSIFVPPGERNIRCIIGHRV